MLARRAYAPLAVLASLLVAAAAPRPASAAEVILPDRPAARAPTDADKARASDAYAAAGADFARRRYEAALAHADEAYAAVPNASTALVRATVLAAMGRDRAAFQAFLLASDLSPTDAERALIDQGLATHGAALGLAWVTLTSAPPGARVKIGGVAFEGERTVGASPGSHRATARLDGYELAVTTVEVTAAGTGQRREIALLPLPAGGGWQTPEPAPAPVDPGPADATVAWVGIGFGGAALIAGIIAQVAADDAAADASAWSAPRDGVDEATRRARYDAAVEDVDLYNGVALGMYLVAAAGVTTGVVMLLTADDAGASGGDEADAAWRIEVAPAPGGGYVGLGASF